MPSIEKQIRDYVVSRQSDELLSERDIASRLNATRSQVREVLLALEGCGLLHRRPQRGYAFVEYSEADLGIARYLRFFIEHEAARMANGRVTGEERRQVEEILEKMDEAGRQRDFLRFAELDAAFHTALVGLSHDNLLIHLFSFVSMVTFPNDMTAAERFAGHEEYYAFTQEAHRQILDCICNGSQEDVHVVLNTHLGVSAMARLMGERLLHDLTRDAPASRKGRPAVWTDSQLERAKRDSSGIRFHSPEIAGLVVMLQAYHNLTGEEIAELFGVSPSSVDRLVHHFRTNQAPQQPAGRGRGHSLLSMDDAQSILEPLGRNGDGATITELQAALESRLGHPVRPNYLYKLLAKLGWRKIAVKGQNALWRPPEG